MIEEKADIALFISGSLFAINSFLEPHPFVRTFRFWAFKISLVFACPMPPKMPSFFNIVTPLRFETYVAILATFLLVCLVGIFINKVYRTIPHRTNNWKW